MQGSHTCTCHQHRPTLRRQASPVGVTSCWSLCTRRAFEVAESINTWMKLNREKCKNPGSKMHPCEGSPLGCEMYEK